MPEFADVPLVEILAFSFAYEQGDYHVAYVVVGLHEVYVFAKAVVALHAEILHMSFRFGVRGSVTFDGPFSRALVPFLDE